MSMPWIKLYSEILDDPKIGRLPDATKWRFVQILLVAGECDAEGYLVNGEEMLGISDLAWRLRVDENVLREDFDILEKAGLIADDGGAWLVVNFSKRQGRSQSEKREMWRERKQRQRERDRAEDEEPITGDDEIPQESVTGDSQENHAPRVEKSREEKEEEKKNGADAPNSLSSGLRHFLDAFGRKRFATKIQKQVLAECEQSVGTQIFMRAIDWGARNNIRGVDAIITTAKKMARDGSNSDPPEAPHPIVVAALDEKPEWMR